MFVMRDTSDFSVQPLFDQNEQSSSIERGKRLHILRRFARLSRPVVQAKYAVSMSSLKNWEKAKAGGLTKKGARKMIQAFHKEGVFCTLEWLLYGMGCPPKLNFYHPRNMGRLNSARLAEVRAELEIIHQELQVFQGLHLRAMVFEVHDDAMGPFYKPGDIVGGKKFSQFSIPKVSGQDCLVETQDHQILFRRVLFNPKTKKYSLWATNPHTILEYPILHNQVLLNAAPVVWHRRRDHIF